jgi:hypothetical protein
MDWSSSTVRSVLQRELYHGVVVWNRSRKRNDWGQVDQRDRPASEWLRVEMPTLRIISDDLWTRVQARLEQTEGHAMRFAGGRLAGRPPKHGIVNLLAGLATCGVCGGSLVVETSARKGKRVAEYVCHSRRHKGTCGNTLRASADVMHESVLHWLEEQVFTPEALEHVIQFTETTHQQSTDRRQALEREQRDLKRRIENLHRAIEDGGDSTSLVQRLRQQESRLAAVEAEQASLRPVPRLAEAVVRDRLEEWRRLVRGSVTQGRTVIQRVVDGRLTFVPREDGYGYDFTAKTRFDRVFAGCVIQVPANERRDDDLNVVFDASDTLDADYGRLLNALYGMSFLSDR